ncbi:hypothetical protein BH20ACT11_BH20ACT11_09910 [soil metagenome]
MRLCKDLIHYRVQDMIPGRLYGKNRKAAWKWGL